MIDKYEGLLINLGISPDGNSFEISRQLKEKKNERKSMMTSRQSREENRRLEEEIHAINEAEIYFEKLAEEEKKEDKLDGFDYSSLQNKGRKRRRAKMVVSAQADDVQEDELSFEERYDNIIGFMGTPDGFDDGLKQLEQLAEDGYVVAQRRVGDMYFEGEKGIDVNWQTAAYWYEKAANQGDAQSQNSMGIFFANTNEYFPRDREQAIKWFKMAAEQDLPVACWNTAYSFDGLFELIDKNEAFNWYKRAAELGYIKAFNELGRYYYEGWGTEKNIPEAIKWYEEAAEEGNVNAYWNLGLVYQYEEVKDDKKAFYWYKKAAESGETKAYNKVGVYYQNGRGTEKNVEEAIKWYEKAAEQGDVDAYWNLGLVYEYEEVKNDEKAFYWYKKAAESGIVEAYNKVGVYYKNGYGVEKNVEEAIKSYEKAAEQGYTDVYWNLGLVYEYEEVKNDEKAFYWYKKAAESGETKAYNKLGIYYQNGRGTEKNVEEAIKWYEKAAEQGDVDAYWNLGLVYEYEEVKNDEKAFYWYKKAAESGETKAYNKVGVYYYNGYGVEKNVEEAIKWYEKAAEQGYTDVYWNLGLVYQYEEVKDDKKAFYWYKKAAESGMAKACNKVGVYYKNGRGTEKNVEEAIKWYEKAAEQGDVDAYWNLGHIYELKAANDDFGDAFDGMFDELFGGPASEENYIQKSAYWYQKSAESGDSEGMYKLGKIYENNFHNNYEAAQWYLKAIQAGYQDAQTAFDRLSGK